jgi:hypothetical protein
MAWHNFKEKMERRIGLLGRRRVVNRRQQRKETEGPV